MKIDVNKQIQDTSEAVVSTIARQQSDFLQAATLQFWNKAQEGFKGIFAMFLGSFEMCVTAFKAGMTAMRDKVKATLRSFTDLIQNARTWIDTLFNDD